MERMSSTKPSSVHCFRPYHEFTINGMIRLIDILVSWIVSDPRLLILPLPDLTIRRVIKKRRILEALQCRREYQSPKSMLKSMLKFTFEELLKNYMEQLTALSADPVAAEHFHARYREESQDGQQLSISSQPYKCCIDIALPELDIIRSDRRLMKKDPEFILNSSVLRWVDRLQQRYDQCWGPKAMHRVEVDIKCLRTLLEDYYIWVASHRAKHYHRCMVDKERKSLLQWQETFTLILQTTAHNLVASCINEEVHSLAMDVATEAVMEVALQILTV